MEQLFEQKSVICVSVQRFGLMPSQKDSITVQELDAVAKWMVANLHMDKNEHDNNQKK